MDKELFDKLTVLMANNAYQTAHIELNAKKLTSYLMEQNKRIKDIINEMKENDA